MIAFLVGVVDLHKHTQMEVGVEKAMKTYQAAAVKAQKEKEVVEGQFAILDSEKTALNKALGKAKAARDEAIAMVDYLKSEQERLIQMAKEEVKKKVAKAIFEKEESIKALEEERADRKVTKITIKKEAKEEAISDIFKYGMNYKSFSLFMIRKKYHDLDFSDINFIDMEGYNILDPANRLEPIGDLNIGESTPVAANEVDAREFREDGVGEIQVESIEGIQVVDAEDRF